MDDYDTVHVDSAVKEWLKKKNRNIVSITTRLAPGCCGALESIDISYKAPKTGHYQVRHEDDLTIYIDSRIPLKEDEDEVSLKLMGKSFFSSIYVGGLNVVQ